MSDIVSIGRRVSSVNASPQFSNYSKVIIHVSEDTTYEVGNDTGRTLEINNPFGTQAMAQSILDSLTGYQYQPYSADGALLNPAAEIGDAANMRGVYGGIYTRSRDFNRLMKANISAPEDEEINHEYKYESPTERKFTRQINDVKASLIIANDSINAKVSKTGGDNSSFGWTLTDTSHAWYANSRKVMEVTSSGLSVEGKVTATSGKIGGFNISASAIWNNISSMSGSQSTGVYVGTDGIKLGNKFTVTSTGEVEATQMKLWGSLYFWDSTSRTYKTLNANNLRSGAESAYNSGSYWSGGAGYGYNYNNATISGTGSYPNHFTCGYLSAKSGFSFGGYIWGTQTLNYKDHTGTNRSVIILTGRA